MNSYGELISAVRVLISEDPSEGRFVLGRNNQVVVAPTTQTQPNQTVLTSRSESGPGGDNSKSQLQMVLARAGHPTPIYKTRQLGINQFVSTVEFNGVAKTGQPCGNKKNAEKDAAAEALQWLMGETRTGNNYINHMSVVLKKSKKNP